ncbi:MAG: hypothetical protein M3417_04305, partial [Actinomycetota bacterium]|nr:hypothetical protein [Actinomycetota bacterium]
AYTDNRWTGAVWFTGVLVAMLAAAAMILRVDRPIRLSREALPAVSPCALILAAVGAWTVAGAVTLYGALGDRPEALYAGGSRLSSVLTTELPQPDAIRSSCRRT